MQKTSLLIVLSQTTALAGCVSTEQRPSASNDRQTLLHAIEGTKLTNLMRRRQNLPLENWLTEPELNAQRQQATSLVSAVAEGAENIVDCILAVKPESNLDADRQQLVHSLTDKLRDEAKTLRYQAQVFKFDDIPATLKQMDATCSTCHKVFNLSTEPAS